MRNRITIICFLSLIFGLSLLSVFKKDRDFSENENRVLDKKPELEWHTLMNGEYGSKYEDYISDQFIFRDRWISLKTYSDLAIMKNQVNGVYFCKDGYLINAHTREEYNSNNSEKNYGYVQDFVNRYKDKADVKLMIVPTSQEILKNKLPAYADDAGEAQIISNIYHDIESKNVINITDTLCSHSSEYIFYRTDHHWTTLGAYYAYVEYMTGIGKNAHKQDDYNIEKVTGEFYGTNSSKVNIRSKADNIYLYYLKNNINVSIRYNESEDVKDTMYDMKLLNTKDKYRVFLGGNNAFLEINTMSDSQNDRKSGERLLVIKDSYAHSFIPFLADSFTDIDVVDLRYYNKNVNDLISEKDYSHILILYNIYNLATDNNIYKLSLD